MKKALTTTNPKSLPADPHGVNGALLRTMLQVAVPIWAMELRHTPFEELQERAKKCGDVICEHGDKILFKSEKEGETAEAFNRLAEAIAILSFAPGGVTVFDEHFENQHKDVIAKPKPAKVKKHDARPPRLDSVLAGDIVSGPVLAKAITAAIPRLEDVVGDDEQQALPAPEEA